MLLKEKILIVSMMALLGLTGCGDRPVGEKSTDPIVVDNDGDGYFPNLPEEDPSYDPDDTDPCSPDRNAPTCEEDDDGDGIINPEDPDPLDACNPNNEARTCDQEPDGLKNYEEENLGTDPKVADTDGDGLYDGEEVNNIDDTHTSLRPERTSDPLDPCDPDVTIGVCDQDEDGLTNAEEAEAETNATNPDTDGDGVLDGVDGTDGATALLSCLPAQEPLYSEYDKNNTMWQIEDCDGDGYLNGSEDNSTMEDFVQPLSDPYDPPHACFIFKNFKYCEAHVADGNTWLDRNLQAKQVCETANDTKCYGSLYQWGRGADGHELNNSATMEGPVGVLEYDGTNEKFVTMDEGSEDAPNDWGDNDDDGEVRESAWHNNDHDLLSICPEGWYVPSIDELKQAFLDDNITGIENAMSGVFKLGSAGKRSSLGEIEEEREGIYYWSHTPSGKSSESRFINTGVGTKEEDRSVGYSIRCIKK